MPEGPISLYPEMRRRKAGPGLLANFLIVMLHLGMLTSALCFCGIVPIPPWLGSLLPARLASPSRPVPPASPAIVPPGRATTPVGAGQPPARPDAGKRASASATPPQLASPSPALPASAPATPPASAPAPDPRPAASRAKNPTLREARDVSNPARPATPEEVLAENHLALSRGYYVLGGEAEVASRLPGIAAMKGRLVEVEGRIEQVIRHQDQINEREKAVPFAAAEVDRTRLVLDALPPAINSADREVHDLARNQWLAARARQQDLGREIREMRAQQVSPADWKSIGKTRYDLGVAFEADLQAVRDLAGSLEEEYRVLTEKAEVVDAVARSGGKLGPSDRYREALRGLARVEREWKALQAEFRPTSYRPTSPRR